MKHKLFYEREGLYYIAMCTSTACRKMDLDERTIRRREKSARCFFPEWDTVLESFGVIVRIAIAQDEYLWMVDSEAAALMIGCKAGTVEKYMEVMRHLRYIPNEFRHIPEGHGSVPRISRMPVCMRDVLKVESFPDIVEQEEEETEIGEGMMMIGALDESRFELPPVSEMEDDVFFF